ncbi:uncharacterized protein [Typha latifolia]|uniref:uncharacterized protein isoform X3 n=1 Tax=Typha latifolia TaxID=4733 RepID=UPI003C2D9124
MLEDVDRGMNGGFVQVHQSCWENSEEELSVLPRHTKVVVTGNNRTKSVLVGLQGVVKKAVGLGGWHWLVLTNGIEVKLQRNALSVIEAPTGNEDDEELECENMHWNGSNLASEDIQSDRPYKSRSRQHKGSAHKSLSRSQSCDSHSKGLVSSPSSTMNMCQVLEGDSLDGVLFLLSVLVLIQLLFFSSPLLLAHLIQAFAVFS